ncbi:hypothetical protein NG783_10430 [Aliarcobacter cryaerophilus]|uniref:hypothetical protein n=1 Tax=Aliarcobacter cryaerophilus TaxID=28198 RepID=UPI003DA5F5C5
MEYRTAGKIGGRISGYKKRVASYYRFKRVSYLVIDIMEKNEYFYPSYAVIRRIHKDLYNITPSNTTIKNFDYMFGNCQRDKVADNISIKIYEDFSQNGTRIKRILDLTDDEIDKSEDML